jgi:hypothetical protein
MKKVKNIFMGILLVAGIVTGFSASPANADPCSASDPCMTFAEVDSSNVVVNIIVCQPSVCGASGSWAGVHPGNGNRLVPQVAANPVTHENMGGYLNGPGNSQVTESNGTFTLNGDAGPIVRTKVIETNEETTIVNTVVNSTGAKGFSYEDTVSDPSSINMRPVNELPNNTGAQVNITNINKEDNSQISINESFEERVSESNFENTINYKYSSDIDLMTLININWDLILEFLDIWFLK